MALTQDDPILRDAQVSPEPNPSQQVIQSVSLLLISVDQKVTRLVDAFHLLEYQTDKCRGAGLTPLDHILSSHPILAYIGYSQ